MSLTDHPEQVLGSIDRTHLFLCPHLDTWPSNESLSNLSVLWSFKTVQEVRAQ